LGVSPEAKQKEKIISARQKLSEIVRNCQKLSEIVRNRQKLPALEIEKIDKASEIAIFPKSLNRLQSLSPDYSVEEKRRSRCYLALRSAGRYRRAAGE